MTEDRPGAAARPAPDHQSAGRRSPIAVDAVIVWLKPVAVGLMLAALLLFAVGLVRSNEMVRGVITAASGDLPRAAIALRDLERTILAVVAGLPSADRTIPDEPDITRNRLDHIRELTIAIDGTGMGAIIRALPDGGPVLDTLRATLRRADSAADPGEMVRELRPIAARLAGLLPRIEEKTAEARMAASVELQTLQTMSMLSATGVVVSVTGLALLSVIMQFRLRASRGRLRDAIEAMSDGFLHIDRNGRVTVANERLRSHLPRTMASVHRGQPSGLLAAALAASAADPETAHRRLLHVLDSLPEPGRALLPALDVRLADERWLRLRVRVGSDGGRAVTVADVTDLVAAEHARHRQALVFKHLTDGVVLADADGRIMDVSPAAEQLYGVSAAAIEGRPIGLLLRPSDAEQMTRALLDELSGCETAERAFPIARPGPDGSFSPTGRDGEATFVALRETSAGFGGVIALIRDVSEIHRVHKLKAAFIAAAAHELRTPTTALLGALRLANSGVGGDVPPQLTALLAMASRNADRLTSVIDGLVDVERLESGSFTLARQPVRLVDLLATISHRARDLPHVGLTVSGPTDETGHAEATTVMMDPERLAQALLGVVDQVAGPQPRIGSRTAVRLAWGLNDHRVRMSVEQPGAANLTMETMPRPTGNRSAPPRRPGDIGFGLAVTRAVVERHGGLIWWETTDAGSRFRIDLPLHRTG